MPIMGDLPAEQLSATRSFSHVGLDFGGRIYTKVSNTNLDKSYIALFVCMATKANHIELVSYLTTMACIAALKRFTSRRGLPAPTFSDNGTNFVGARIELSALQDILEKESSNSLASYSSSKGVTWLMIPPRAPNFGGQWEAGIKSCKNLLRKVIGKQTLPFEELYTVFTQVEAALNPRPLSPMSSDPNDFEFLTPGHFIIGSSLDALPEPYVANDKWQASTLPQRWKLTQQITQSFWKRWHLEYFYNLRQRTKWRKETANFEVGDLMLIEEDNSPSITWPRGRQKLLLAMMT